MMTSKDLLVDAARKLFAEKGFFATDMIDIHKAAGLSRRTLYTYFNSKEEIYNAVIESELKQLSDRLREVVEKKDVGPNEKLMQYISVRMDAVKDVVLRNGKLRAEFFLDAKRVEHVRRKLDFREKKILREILVEGIEQGVFERRDPEFTALCMHYCLKGFEVPYVKGVFDRITLRKRELIIEMLMDGLRKRR
ncbi:MAG: TetR/AcrR family transcriptional regulator [Paludibacteraceae bacterium]|nr:TetR/AcrR family transcriptional regulator [Paludibacteraceae bacterium]